jgi:1-acyl-sn-glycerol-3-phosphate acyltransferase
LKLVFGHVGSPFCLAFQRSIAQQNYKGTSLRAQTSPKIPDDNSEFALIPFLGWATSLQGWVVIQQWPKQAKRQLRKAARYAGNGGLTLISAEGKRSIDGELNPYKTGAAVLSIESQAPIHPLYITGARECFAVGQCNIRPGTIVIHYLAPIPTKGLTYEDLNSLLKKRRTVAEVEHAQWLLMR